MNRLVWCREQFYVSMDYYLCMYYDDVKDKVSIKTMTDFQTEHSGGSDEVNLFLSKFLMCSRFIFGRGVESKFHGVEIYRANGVICYACVLNLHSPYIILESAEVLSSLTRKSIEGLCLDLCCVHSDRYYMCISCNINVLMLMFKSNVFKMTVLGCLDYKCYCENRPCNVSALEGIVYE